MSARPDDRGFPDRECAKKRLAYDSVRATFDREALENFAEVLSILQEWAQGERREKENSGTSDPVDACSPEREAVDWS